ncbi:MAG: transposase, partial [Elusimicrobiota bacterium]|nr:transposase [Elusimicrobiota bacterium]
NIDPQETWVTFSYKQRNQPEVKLTLWVEDFIQRLTQHILPPTFRQVRYYGVLSNRVRTKLLKVVFKLLKVKKEVKKILSYRQLCIKIAGVDPLACPICQRPMQLVEVAFFSKKSNSLQIYHPP